MKVEKIKVSPASFAELMMDIKRGVIRIPRFQRDFVWERKKIQELLDSMYREFPIGTIFLWEALPKYNHLLRTVDYLEQEPIDEQYGRYAFVLDGQQRLTSLYAVWRGIPIGNDDYNKIVIDLDKDEAGERIFQYREPDNRRWVSVRTVLEDDPEVYDKLPSPEYRQRFTRCHRLLTNYPFSIVRVREMEIEEAIEIFERINRLGKRLTRYDLITASVLTDDFDLREKSEADIIEPLKDSFGKIPETSIPQALALNIRGKTEHAVQMALKAEDVQNVWDRTVESFRAAVDFVRQNLGVARADFLPYDAMLPVLQYYFYYADTRSPRSPEHNTQLKHWFWRTAFSERYSGSSQTRMTEDAAWIRDLVDRDSSCEISVTIATSTLINSSMSYTTSAIRNGVLCLLNLRNPLHFENGTRVRIEGEHFSKFTQAEKHHIFPAAFLKRQGLPIKSVHALPNFCFIPADLNKRIGDRPPSQYMQEIRDIHGEEHFERVMHSHLIPVDGRSGVWTDNYDRFLKQRAAFLLDEIRRQCGIIEGIPEEQRNPVIDALEIALRENIHRRLSARYGNSYWRQCIPSDVKRRVEGFVESEIKKRPGTTKSQFTDPRRKLGFCGISDYSKIILSNWNEFSSVFRDKRELERYLGDFREFRNAVKHSRSVDRQLELRAKAAMLWLAPALGVELDEYNILGS